jgi:hypothetical protein
MARLRLVNTGKERREERRARAALKREIKSGGQHGETVALQLFGQAMPPSVYERFRRITNENLKRRHIRQALPDSQGHGMVVLWGLEAGTEMVPMPSVRDFPRLLGKTVAVRCRGAADYRGGFVAALNSWLLLNVDAAPAWLLAPPVLQSWHLDGVESVEIVDFGLDYPLPALDVVAA